jgi:poly-gamma-glutamate synthesis protein (capsule biosynthesis protein)
VTASVTLALAGDVMLGRGVNRRISELGPMHPWGDILADIQQADRFLINLECAVTSHRKRWRNGAKAFYFRAHPRAVKTLLSARVDFAGLANNHAVDYGTTGLLDTVRHLDEAGISHAGAGANLMDAAEPAFLAAGHWRIGVLAYADYPTEWAAGATTPGINYAPISVAADDFSVIARALEATRQQADLVIFSIHWGPNMRERPTAEYRDFARRVIDAGADVFWGHSAHLVHGVELWHDKPIIYDTGDFVDDYEVDTDLRNDLSALFLLRARPPAVERLDLIPVVISDRQVNRAQGTDREWFCQRFTTLSAELGTPVRTTHRSLAIVVSDTASQAAIDPVRRS